MWRETMGLASAVWICLLGGAVLGAKETDAVGMTREGAERAARQYLELPAREREAQQGALRDYRGPIEPVIEALRPAAGRGEARKGEIRKEHFTAPGLRAKHPDDLLYFFVPGGYDPAKPFGLLIFMHGGDGSTPREWAGVIVSSPADDPQSYGLRPEIEKGSFITVAPSAPLPGGGQRWNTPDVDGYIAAVIEECAHRFNLDRDRVFLGGHSMGAYGAYHLCQRLNDRIAGGLFSAGAWRTADFRCLMGTGVFVIHGRNDTAPGASPIKSQGTRRNDWTGVSFARAAAELMKRDGVEHLYREHDGGHAFLDGREGVAEFVRMTGTWRRDPFPKRVLAASPRGSWMIDSVAAAAHSYWVSINEIGTGKIEYDSIRLTGPNVAKTAEDLARQGYTLGKTSLPGGRVDAVLKGDNLVEVKTENVRSFSLWLHPKMVDFSRPVSVVLNGARTEHQVRPSLLDALRSYERKKDWGLIYQAELAMTVKGN